MIDVSERTPCAPARTGGDDDVQVDDILRGTLALVLAGGQGTRLHELGTTCAKPAVPFAGHWRLVDLTLANAINSGLRRIGVVTQHCAATVTEHVDRHWRRLDTERGVFVPILLPPRRCGTDAYRGTADAVWRNLDLAQDPQVRHVLVLAGDHVCRMDLRPLLAEHVRRGAPATVATVTVPARECRAFGVVEADGSGRVRRFVEKPRDPLSLGGASGTLQASMGLYAFEVDALRQALAEDAADPASGHDFGNDVLPRLVARGWLWAHDFAPNHAGTRGSAPYWRDVGTLDAYWAAHMDLLEPEPPIDLGDAAWPVPGEFGGLPPARIVGDDGRASLLSAGSVLRSGAFARSVLFPGAVVEHGARVQRSLLLPGAVVGSGAELDRVIVAPGTRIPARLRIGLNRDEDGAHFRVSPGGVALVTTRMLARP